jgi:membrane-associated phospholipid phosphatase
LNPLPVSWYARLGEQMRRHMLAKALGTTAFITLFFLAYFWLLHNPLHAVTTMPLSTIDRWIPFQPNTLLIYVTLWVYVSLPPALVREFDDLWRYGVAIAAVCITGLAIFALWPSAVPPSGVSWASYPRFAFFEGMDAAGNACPSLHVASAAFSAVWLHLLLREAGAPRPVRVFNWLWCVAIGYSTISTRQHVFLDVVAGAALGVAGAWFAVLARQRRLAQQASRHEDRKAQQEA